MTDWKEVVELLKGLNINHRGYVREAIRLCTAASRLPEGVDPVKVLEGYAEQAWERKRRSGAQGQVASVYDASEREHCARVATEWMRWAEQQAPVSGEVAPISLLERERAAAIEASPELKRLREELQIVRRDAAMVLRQNKRLRARVAELKLDQGKWKGITAGEFNP